MNSKMKSFLLGGLIAFISWIPLLFVLWIK